MNKKILILWTIIILLEILFISNIYSACKDPIEPFYGTSDTFGSKFGCGFFFKPLNILVFNGDWVYYSFILLPIAIGIVITYFVIKK